MSSKCNLTQLKFTRAAAILFSKKKKFETSLVLNLAHLKINDNKANTPDTNNTEGELISGFWNESVNETDSNFEEKREGNKREKEYEDNIEIEKPKTKKAVSRKLEIK